MKISLVLLSLSLILMTGCSKPSAEEMFKKGVDAQLAQQYNDAIASYEELIKTYPDSARAGGILCRRSDLSELLEVLSPGN